ncbi:MAG: ABC transporter ATP-binding protein/permease [Clostridium sp.]|nr:ABC transporter ATP-binding protein/permease [Clostridium sp.]
MRTVYKYIKPVLWPMIGGLTLKFIAAMFDLTIPYFLETIIDKAAPTGQINQVLFWGVVMLVCSVLALVTNVTANRMAVRNTSKVTKTLRHDLFAKISHLSARKTDEFTVSSLISRLTTDSYNVNDMLVRVQRIGVRAPFLLIGGIIITLTLDPVLTLVLVAMLPIIAVVVYFVTKYSVPIYTHCQQILDKLVRTVQENATGVRVIKALGKGEHERKRFDNVNAGLANENKKAGVIMAITNPAATIVLNIGLTLVVIVGARRVNSGLTEPGTILAFLSYFTIILNAMLGITRVFVICSKGSASAKRIESVLLAEDDMPILPEEENAQTENADAPHIEFRGVTFSYNKKEETDGLRSEERDYIKNNLTDISFTLNRGQTLGIIGATGSGKSTIVNLLIRFYDPDKGTVLVDGRDVRCISREELCKKFGIAFQNDFIMANSIFENISFGRDLTEEQVNRAIVLAQAKQMIDELPEGTGYRLTARGTNISGGQKQRMLIARAVAAEPEILILDDSSSALDYKTDASLRKALHSSLPDTTTVIIAQRVSSIMNADLILVLDEGSIIGRGRHSELMESCPEYKLIADTQMGGAA